MQKLSLTKKLKEHKHNLKHMFLFQAYYKMAFTSLGWNPMESAYKNANINRYENGPGADLDENQQPGSSHRHESFAVHLKNLPPNLDEHGIKNLCLKYCKYVHEIKMFSGRTSIVVFKELAYEI